VQTIVRIFYLGHALPPILTLFPSSGMAIAPWDAIGGGKFRTKKQLEEGGRGTQNRTENEIKMAEALEKVAQEHGIESPTAIALAWLLQKTPYVFPIIGTRKVENMLDNTQALKINLTPAQVEYLESIVPFSVGYPADVFGEDPHVVGKPGVMAASAAPTLWVPAQKAIQA
jgi:aryl-alcohol dehydrogenase-like predicted oxidoreductase